MTSVSDVAAPAKVCTCYAREDDGLRSELHKHMVPMERLGLIQSWYDRDIPPGGDWASEIDEHLRNADFILLLISADFVNSRYCYEVEMKFALQCHDDGTAVVIPILLRQVDYRGLPFARLQALPSDGIPVVSGKEGEDPVVRDVAFASIAKSLREAIQSFRTQKIQGYQKKTGSEWVLQRRALEAAVTREIPKGESREVLVLVSIEGSEGLRFIIGQDEQRQQRVRGYTSSIGDIRSAAFEIDLPLTTGGFLRSPSLLLRIEGPGFTLPQRELRIAIPVLDDSKPYSFLLRGDIEGQHALLVELVCDDVIIVQQLLHTRVLEHGGPDRPPPAGGGGIVLASVTLDVACVAKAAGASG